MKSKTKKRTLRKVNRFDDAEIIISRHSSTSDWCQARVYNDYSNVICSGTVQEILAFLRKETQYNTYMIRHQHVCEEPGCKTKSEYGFCVYHHFTKRDGTPRKLGILALPLE